MAENKLSKKEYQRKRMLDIASKLQECVDTLMSDVDELDSAPKRSKRDAERIEETYMDW